MLICLVRVVALGYNKVCSQILSLDLGPLNNIFSTYKQNGKAQEKFNQTKIWKEI